jgi:hypothetical protein
MMYYGNDDIELELNDTDLETPKCRIKNCGGCDTVFRCTRCNSYLCGSKDCWASQVAHDSEPCEHEQSLVDDFKIVFETLPLEDEKQVGPVSAPATEDVSGEEARAKKTRKKEAGNMWFGVTKKNERVYVLGEGIAYENLVLKNPSTSPGITYPSVVSFIGETGRR